MKRFYSQAAFKSAKCAFTLIELLTVIAIIAILMSLLAPALFTAKQHARIALAKGDIADICTGVQSFYTDYGTYPLPPNTSVTGSGASGDYTYGDPSASGAQTTNNYLFDVLRAYQGSSTTAANVIAENSRLTPYVTPMNVKDAANPKSGIATQPTGSIPAGSWVDPWGQPYNVRVDASYSSHVYFNPPYTDTNVTVGYLMMSTIVWSYGPDQQLGAGGNGNISGASFDDVLSWR